jgi:hypothetical protein
MHDCAYNIPSSIAVKAVVELVKFCLSIPGVKCVLTEHLNQDPLEAFFGRQRMSCGRNDNPSVSTFLKNAVSLRVKGLAALQPFSSPVILSQKRVNLGLIAREGFLNVSYIKMCSTTY